MHAGEWFHRKNNRLNRILSPRHEVQGVDGGGAAAAGADAGGAHAHPGKPHGWISPPARPSRKQPHPGRNPRQRYRRGRMFPRSAGRQMKCGKLSNHSNRPWSKWKKCWNWSNWRNARNPAMSAKLTRCAGRCGEFSHRAATRSQRTNPAASPAATKIPPPPASGDGSRRERCGSRTGVCAVSQSAPAIARRRRP